MIKRTVTEHIDLILFNKPCNVLCQFTDVQNRPNLSHYINEPEFYACGRLDRDSEGLLVLTDHGKLQHLISEPHYKLGKSYWIQVDGCPTAVELDKLRAGIELKDGMTKPCTIKAIPEPAVCPRIPPIRTRKNQPTSWLDITLTEGRNRQVRRMTAAIGYPTLRLIRHRIGNWSSADIASGELVRQQVHIETLPAAWRKYLSENKASRQSSVTHHKSRRTHRRGSR